MMGHKLFQEMKMMGLPLFSEKKMTGSRLFWGHKISHFPLCRTIDFAPSLMPHSDLLAGRHLCYSDLLVEFVKSSIRYQETRCGRC